MLIDRIVHIVPKLRPQLDGVGEYAYLLAEETKKCFAIDSTFIVADNNWVQGNDSLNFPVKLIRERLVSCMMQTLSELTTPTTAFILHYVGYGYAKKGAPFWLEKAIRGWKVMFPDAKIITFFHEVAASSSPWRSAFWMRPFQEHVAAQLALVSDTCVTSNSINAASLLKLAGQIKDKLHVLPVCSTVGEPINLNMCQEREGKLVIFGTRGRRAEVYKREDLLERIVSELKITEVFDIGPKLDNIQSRKMPDSISSAKLYVKGILTPQQITDILIKAKYAIVDCPTTILGRSTIFAAYCSHGLIPLVFGGGTSEATIDGLEACKNYISVQEQVSFPAPYKLEEIAKQAFDWYKDHNLNEHASAYINFFNTLERV